MNMISEIELRRLQNEALFQHLRADRAEAEVARLRLLLPLLKECREALAATCRFAVSRDIVIEFTEALRAAGIEDGIGVRIQTAIKLAEAGGNK